MSVRLAQFGVLPVLRGDEYELCEFPRTNLAGFNARKA